jgi:hypothetical protein
MLVGAVVVGPTTSTVTQSNIPDWLRPQTEALLGAGTQEYFNTEFNPETGGYDITGTKPYTPYSADPRDYVAQFSPQQQQVFAEAAGMQTPGGFQTGQQMTGTAGMGGLDTAGQALGYGAQAAGMGGMYEQMATNPMAMQAYMSPYMQNVVEIQKQAAIEDAQRAQLGANLGAARQGTYGGARQTLAQTQREAGLNKQLLIFKVWDFNQRLIKHKNHNSLVLLQVFKDFKPVFRAFKVLKLGLHFLEEWVNKLQILVRHNNKLILLDLGSKANG